MAPVHVRAQHVTSSPCRHLYRPNGESTGPNRCHAPVLRLTRGKTGQEQGQQGATMMASEEKGRTKVKPGPASVASFERMVGTVQRGLCRCSRQRSAIPWLPRSVVSWLSPAAIGAAPRRGPLCTAVGFGRFSDCRRDRRALAFILPSSLPRTGVHAGSPALSRVLPAVLDCDFSRQLFRIHLCREQRAPTALLYRFFPGTSRGSQVAFHGGAPCFHR